jgi:alpha-1,2-glucosyltransferase
LEAILFVLIECCTLSQDEIFHVPQAQRYCQAQFDTYDPKLTTPPGLYFVSLGLAKTVNYAGRIIPFGSKESAAMLCNTLSQLRYTCLLFLLSLPWLLSSYKHKSREIPKEGSKSDIVSLRSVVKPTSAMEAMTVATANPSKAAQTIRRSVVIRQNQTLSRRQRGIWGVFGSTLDNFYLTLEVHILSLLPPLWFFGFLYYTDVPSVVLVMAMLSASKRNKNGLAALVRETLVLPTSHSND